MKLAARSSANEASLMTPTVWRSPYVNGAGDGNRTHDIQLGKQQWCEYYQELGCKTVQTRLEADQCVTSTKQNSGTPPATRSYACEKTKLRRQEVARTRSGLFKHAQIVNEAGKTACPDRVSLAVEGLLPRTAKPHGLSKPEVARLNGAIHHMRTDRMSVGQSIWWASTDKDGERALITAVLKRLHQLQRRAKLPQYSAHVLEATNRKVHTHIFFVATEKMAESLAASFNGQLDVDLPYDLDGLTRGYVLKTRTSSANFRSGDFYRGGRVKGSHQLPGAGDRVRLSRELERDAIEAERVAPWEHTNARRTKCRKEYRPRVLRRTALRPAGQIPLFPDQRPVARFRDFGGGLVPPAVAREIEFHRQRSGLFQRQLANMIGLSQGQYANAIRGHDPLSSKAVNRLRDVLSFHAKCR
jgi:hypothetical protein